MKININKVVRKLSPKALKLLGNRGKVLSLALEAADKITAKRALSDLGREGKLALNLVIDWSKGYYRGVQKKNLIKILVAILYLLNPLDIVPDFLLGLGFLDDFAVFMGILHRVESEIRAYDAWKSSGEGDAFDIESGDFPRASEA